MDPAKTLQLASIAVHKGKTAGGWRALEYFGRAGEHLNDYWAWRNRGGFEPDGGDRQAEDLAEELSDAWEKESDEQDRDRAEHADYFENPKETKKLKAKLLR